MDRIYSVPYLMRYDDTKRDFSVIARSKQEARRKAINDLLSNPNVSRVGELNSIRDLGEVNEQLPQDEFNKVMDNARTLMRKNPTADALKIAEYVCREYENQPHYTETLFQVTYSLVHNLVHALEVDIS